MSANNNARVAATLYGAVRHSVGDTDYCAKLMLEYVVLYGSVYRAAKHPIEIMNARNESDFREAVKDNLVAHLNTKFPGENFRARDVMLFGI